MLIEKQSMSKVQKKKVQLALLDSEWKELEDYFSFQEFEGGDQEYFFSECVRRILQAAEMKKFLKERRTTSEKSKPHPAAAQVQ